MPNQRAKNKRYLSAWLDEELYGDLLDRAAAEDKDVTALTKELLQHGLHDARRKHAGIIKQAHKAVSKKNRESRNKK